MASDADEFSFAALRREAANRGTGVTLGKFDQMRKLGPHHTTSPKEVIEHVVMELQEGNLSAPFTFTSMPPWRQGTHRSSTDWSQRMAWDKATIINGHPSGSTVTFDSFSAMVRERYASLLQTSQYRFVGDASAWQTKQGREMPTDEKEYVVEVQTRNGEHCLVKFRLVYDWLLHCHLVSTVALFSATHDKHFPGEEETQLGI